MSTELYFLILGMVLGAGLVRLPAAIHQIIERRQLLKSLDFDRRIDAEIQRRELARWGIITTPHSTSVDLTPCDAPESADRPRSTADTDWAR